MPEMNLNPPTLKQKKSFRGEAIPTPLNQILPSEHTINANSLCIRTDVLVVVAIFVQGKGTLEFV